MRPKQPDPVPEMKRAVAAAIVAKLDGWTQEMAAELLHTNQSRVSNLRTGTLDRFSLEQLIRMTTYVHGYAYVEIRFRQDQVGPASTTRAPAGQPPDLKRLTWIAPGGEQPEATAQLGDASFEPPRVLPHP